MNATIALVYIEHIKSNVEFSAKHINDESNHSISL